VDDPLRAALFEEEAVAEKPAEVSNMLDFDLDAELAAPAAAAAEKRQRNRKPRPICSISISIWMALLASQWPARLSLSRLLPRQHRGQ
jgi:hypothetical protein